MVVNLRRGAPVSAGTTLPSAGGLLRDPSCSQLDPSRTLPMESCCPGVKSCVQSVGAAPKKKKKKKKKKIRYEILHKNDGLTFVLVQSLKIPIFGFIKVN